MDNIYFPSLSNRFRVLLIDESIILLLMYLFILFVSIVNLPNHLNLFIILSPLFLYEPLTISFLGGTISQKYYGYEVRTLKNRKLPLYRSFLRYFFKLILGVYSLVFLLFSKRHQTLHDKFVGSILVVKQTDSNLDFQTTISEISVENNYAMPSIFRRYFIFILYSFLILIVVSIIEGIFLGIFSDSKSKDIDRLIGFFANIIFIIFFLKYAYKASDGLLLGAKRKLINIPEHDITDSSDNHSESESMISEDPNL